MTSRPSTFDLLERQRKALGMTDHNVYQTPLRGPYRRRRTPINKEIVITAALSAIMLVTGLALGYFLGVHQVCTF